MILSSRVFTINTLRADQRELAGKLGKSAIQHPDKLTDVAIRLERMVAPSCRTR